ncbi:MAG: hypothetical protein WCJ88_11500 [Actinomycetes bacterium]
MAAIVAIHGAYNEFGGPYELKAQWLPPLRDGLWHHGFEIADSDFEVVFYGDLFRHDPEVEDPSKVEAEQEAVTEFLHNYTADDLYGLFRRTEGRSYFNRTIDLIAKVKNDPNFIEEVHERVRSVVKPDTRVILAHSMGTLVAYRAIALHPEWNVHTLVTMGSMLGLPDTIAELEPKPIDGKGQWPGSIKRWVNVAAEGDPASRVAKLDGLYMGSIEDRLINNGNRPHAPEGFFNSKPVGEAVAAALQAF